MVGLTNALIAVAMAKTEASAYVGHDRRYAFPDRLEDACKTCAPNGRCKAGWIVRKGRRAIYNEWLEVITGMVKLVTQVNT